MYQVGLNGGADPQLVPFFLHFLDQVDEHVCLKQVLKDKKSLLTQSFFPFDDERKSVNKEFFYYSVTETGNGQCYSPLKT